MAVAGYFLDQVTKGWAQQALSLGREIPVVSDLVIFTLFYNSGAAFSFGEKFTFYISVFAIFVLAVLVIINLFRVWDWLQAIAVGLLMAGVGGNLHDRIFNDPKPFYGQVVDFISIKNFAVCNVADVMIVVAAVLIVLWTIITELRRR